MGGLARQTGSGRDAGADDFILQFVRPEGDGDDGDDDESDDNEQDVPPTKLFSSLPIRPWPR